MKRNKITAVILSIVMSMSMMMPSFEVMADETSAPSETQKTESTEKQEPKATETQEPKETEKQEPKVTETQETKKAEKSEAETTETQESKESKTQESKETETQETKVTETQEPKETEKQEPKVTDKQDPKETEEGETDSEDEQEPDETQVTEPETTEGSLPETEAKRKAVNGFSGKINSGLSWSLNDEGTLTIAGSGDMPSYCNWYGVRTKKPWEDYLGSIKSVVISEGITSVGDGLFYECLNLSKVTLPKSLTTIGIYAFSGCSSLSNITIPEGVNSIGGHAFYGCNSLTSVIIPNSVTSIGDSAFSSCQAITSITLSKNLTNIYRYTFSNCTSLTSIDIPGSVNTIGENAFFSCSNLETVSIANGVKSISAKAFYCCSNLSIITIPDSVTSIGDDAFAICKGLKTISIPKGVTSIGNRVFDRCSGLTSVDIPEWINSIGNYSFVDCTSLTSITMNEGLSSIGTCSFSGCTSLETVVIPYSVTTVGTSAFWNCKKLKTVVLNSKIPNRSNAFPSVPDDVFHCYYDVSYANDGCGTIEGKSRTYGTDVVEFNILPDNRYVLSKVTLTAAGETVELKPNDNGKYIMPDVKDSARIKAFFITSGDCGENLKWNLDGDGVLTVSGTGDMFDWNSSTEVPWHDFRNRIISINFSEGITSIGKHAFQSCAKLNKVKIPDGVTSIGDAAFNDCTSLKSIVLNKKAYNSAAFPDYPANVFHYYYDVIYEDYENNEFITVSGKTRSYGTDVFEITLTCKKYYVAENVVLSYPNSSCGLARKTDDKWECIMPDSDSSATLVISVRAACGDNLTWEMDYLDGNPFLRIIGSGRMYDWNNESDAPWSEYKDDITNIVFSDDVTYIGRYSFQGFTAITKIIIPDKVTSIGSNAFKNCTGLKSVVLNTAVNKSLAFPSLSSRIFHYYYDVEYVYYGYGSISGKTRVYGTETIELNISHEENYGLYKLRAFNDKINKNLSFTSGENCTITMPDSNIKVYIEGFFKYSGSANTCGSHLTWTLDDDGVLTISGSGDMANFIGSGYAIPGSDYDDCPWKNYRSNIKKVVFDGDVTSIGNAAFENCSKLSSITISDSIKRIGEKAFTSCTSLTSITIPNNVVSIGEEAFGGCSNLSSVRLPNKISNISNSMFSVCKSLTTIELPDTITKIGNCAFSECSNLSQVNIPNGVTTIGDLAFWECSSLTSMPIPSSVTSLGYGVFADCTGLTSITIPNGVTVLDGTFSGCSNLTSVTIPSSVTTIGDNTFANCSGFRSISIPANVVMIGANAFAGCTGLTSFVIPNGVTSIGYGAFIECTNLRSITIPHNVTSIEEDIFAGCNNITTVIISGDVTSIGDRSFKDCTSLKDFSFPSGVKVIGEEAFAGCKGLTNVTIPDNVKSIGSDAFKECDNIEKVKLPDNNIVLGESSFAYNAKLNSVVLNKSSYNENAFTGCSTNIFHYYYDVTYSNGGHGTISGNQRSYGTDEMQFTVTPEPGYVIDKVTLKYAGKTVELTADNNGSSTNGSMHLQNRAVFVRANSIWGLNKEDLSLSYSYTMPDAENGAEIKATFKKIGYSVSVSETVNGTASVDMSTATVGDVVTVTTTPAKGYEIDTIKVNGTINDGFTFTMPAGNVTVTVTFKKIIYNVSLSDTTNGSASVDKTTAVIDDVVKVSYTPDQGYELDEIKVNDKAITGQEFTMDSGDATVTVTFKKIQYTITVNAADNGSATVSRETAGIGDEVTVIAAPNKGYYLTAIKVNGTNIEGTTFTMPAENVTVELEFSEQLSNTLTVRGGKTAKVKYRKLRKKNQTVSRSKVMTVSNANGSVRYSLVSVKRGKSKKYKKYFKVNATTGTVTVKKKLRKGTYTITCRVTAAGDVEHKAITKTVKFKIKVK